MFIDGNLANLTAAQRDIVVAKPYWRMCAFAAMLNWHGLRLEWIRFTEEEAATWPNVPESRIVVHYVTTDQGFHIQINEVRDRPALYHATVGPFRYGIWQLSIGWHRFELFSNDADLAAEARRLKPFLDRQQFRNPARRAAWKKAHPELVAKKDKKQRFALGSTTSALPPAFRRA
jgi:hypothetical protein